MGKLIKFYVIPLKNIVKKTLRKKIKLKKKFLFKVILCFA